ncbi:MULTISPECIES: Plug domain-containing protein [unclassified Sphingobacterium]|uniref:Plug domain-containing protein n=1 Tax=unclassified Sphingobacterium TaxID=2609468 RepID=UPI00104D4D47|nr:MULTISPECIES: Plug domain-containing protein [unclassified Sphingobacterium]MCS3552372.1 hypothetical protein [Sphingobacterium sp. JUb21]TCR10864.1 hypothetical protein EDF66_101679 [Sphingobacterium sp. JUb20]
MKTILLFALAVLLPTILLAQQKLEGIVLNSDKIPVPYATVQIGAEDKIFHTVRTSQAGVFEINLSEEQVKDAKWIEVRHIAYDILRKEYPVPVKRMDFELIKKTARIAEVEVKSKPRAIARAGDTTRYAVNQFVSAEDRNIGDVLKRMPGVEVDDNGVVKHNGKTVSRMYVDGDQLFQNGYGVGTRTIQPKLVKDVEVIQNHEHKKVKQGVSNSEDVALNLVLHEDAKMSWSGEATVGIAAPLDAFVNTNALSFKKKYKTINTLQYNSIGEGIAQDVDKINSYNLIEPIAATAPSVPENRYYNNNSFAFNTNQFYKWNDNWSVVFNANIWADKEKLYSNESQTYFLQDGNVTYNNYFNSTKKPFYGRSTLAIEGNCDKFFFKNTLDYKSQNQTHHSWLLDNNEQRFDQFGKDRMHIISEAFEYVPRMKNKDLLSLKGSFLSKWHDDDLQITPGVLDVQLNNGLPYQRVRQQVSLPALEGTLGLQYTRNVSRLKRSYFINTRIQRQELNSELNLMTDNSWNNHAAFPNNQLYWNEKNLSTGIILEWKNKDFIISGALPLSWNIWDITNTHMAMPQKTNKLLFNPSMSLQAYLPNRDYFLLTAKFNQNNSDLNQAFQNPILVNFREIESYAAPLYFTKNATYALKYSIERPIEFFYANFTLVHARTSSDYLLGRTITPQGIVSELRTFDNQQLNNSLVIGLSQSLLKSGLFLGFNTSINQSQYSQLLNNNIANATAWNFMINPKVEYKGLPKSTIAYQYMYRKSLNTLAENTNKLANHIHKLSALHRLNDILFLKAAWSYESSRSSSFATVANGFLDASLRLKPLKSKHNFELNFNNILNKCTFRSNVLTAYQQNSQEFPLRGMQAVLKYSFIF